MGHGAKQSAPGYKSGITSMRGRVQTSSSLTKDDETLHFGQNWNWVSYDMVTKKIAPYGDWNSELSSEAVTAGARSLSSPRVDVSHPTQHSMRSS
jgi:hypothetical protein